MLFTIILLWLITLTSVVIYLVAWPAAKPWKTRLTFDISVLVILVFVCFVLQPTTPLSGPEAAEAAQWRPYLSAVYVVAISILLLSIAGTIRHFTFRRSK
jgi:hypothetical protein